MALLDVLTAKSPPIHLDQDGVPRVGGTRVRLDTVIGAFQDGCAAEEILLRYPSLKLQDIYSVIAYYLWNQQEIEAYLEEQRRAADAVRRENEARFPPDGVRERLLARRTGKE
jgi:uncharacterized protein (DUF433 family)